MIYLFEDRKGRMEQFIKGGIDQRFLKEVVFDCTDENIDAFIEINFKDAVCILFHKSYNFPNRKITSDLVKQIFINKQIPFVYFSGGLNNNVLLDNNIYTGNVDSGDMYNNLDEFLTNYKGQKTPNIPLLVYGKGYLLNSLLELQYKITKKLFTYKDDYILNSDDLDEILDLISPRIMEPELKQDKQKFEDWIENNMYKNKISTIIIKSQLEKLIEKY
jgi:hypothetical protein